MNTIKDWLDKHGLKGRKLYAVIGAVTILAAIFIVASLPKKSRTGKAGQASEDRSQSAASGSEQAKPGSALQMPEYGVGTAITKLQDDAARQNKERAGDKREITALKDLIKEQAQVTDSILAKLAEMETRQAGEVPKLREELEALRTAGGAAGSRPGAPLTDVPPVELIRVPPSKDQSQAAPPGLGRAAAKAAPAGESPYYLPAGSMVKATLLNGVEAPPATQGPGLPAVLLIGGKFVGPNSYSIPMKGCMAMGKADGDLSSERVKVGVTLFSCVFPGGRTLDRAVQAYVSGPDGKLGIPGKVHDRRGRQLGMAAMAGFAAGLSQAIGQSEVTRVLTAEGTERTIVSGSTLTFGMSQALSSALAEVTNFYRQEMQRLFPIVVVPSGVEVTLVMEQGVDIPEIDNLVGAEGEGVKGEQ